MPYLHIQISGVADPELAGRVAGAATELTARWLGKDPALTAVVIDFIDARQWHVGGQALSGSARRSYHWRADITDETNTKREKADYLAAVHQAMDRLLDGVAEHSYVHVADLRASAYGYGGRTQEQRFQHPG